MLPSVCTPTARPTPSTSLERYLLRFGVQGYNVSRWERRPLNLTFVIDVSGSMSMENRLEMVKDSLRLLVDQLDERDTVAVVVYGSEAHAVLEPTNGASPDRIIRRHQTLAHRRLHQRRSRAAPGIPLRDGNV